MKRYSRKEIIGRLYQRIEKHEPVIACGAGTGLYARAEEKEGVDIILAGAKSQALINGLAEEECILPYHDVNEVARELAKHLLPVIERTPVITGIGAYNPYIDAGRMIRHVKNLGYSGVINSPGSSAYEARLKQSCFRKEIEFITKAKQEDMFTMAVVKTPDDITAMYDAGADVIVIQCQETVKDRGEYIRYQKLLADSVYELSESIIVLADVGYLTETDDLQRLLTETKAAGIVSEEAVGSLAVQRDMSNTLKEIINFL
ncbi:phosphoenolpyruvate hydrolase family protein [Dorea sp. D27]|uniref:phosphoenolpyruvate hydrolase family protein n=1 Tax=Dorea sp. D27 TaxID=658665 RepID=UPI0006738545|nr:phosphoenolpyruvate hydrolase family protein [Dorea sp. D27]KMZ53542.1 TIM-barrel signal transduction protein [Dorea sp. D27]